MAVTPLGQLVQRCWAQEPGQRPTFTVVAKELEDRLVEAKAASASTGMLPVLPVPATWSPVKDPLLAELVPVDAGAERAEQGKVESVLGVQA